jgi:chemotaxis protein histidine kinase CheA
VDTLPDLMADIAVGRARSKTDRTVVRHRHAQGKTMELSARKELQSRLQPLREKLDQQLDENRLKRFDMMLLGEVLTTLDEFKSTLQECDDQLFFKPVEGLTSFLQQIVMENIVYQTGMSYVLHLFDLMSDALDHYCAGGDAIDDFLLAFERLERLFQGIDKPIAETADVDESALIQDIDPEAAESGMLLEFLLEGEEGLEACEQNLLALENDPGNETLLNTMFRTMHTIKGTSGMLNMPHMVKLSHRIEDLITQIRDGNARLTSAISDIIFKALDSLKQLFLQAGDILRRSGPEPINLARTYEMLSDCMMSIRSPETDLHPPLEHVPIKKSELLVGDDDDLPRLKRLGEILVERGDISQQTLQEMLKAQKPLGELLLDSGKVAPDKLEAALQEQQQQKVHREQSQKDESVASIRVASDKLDKQVALVGELVTVKTRLSQLAEQKQDTEIALIAEEVDRLTSDLRDNTMSVRLLPIGSTFSRFQRTVRDLARDLGKQIVMTTEGEETELDKTVIEQLKDPLMHLIRNCVDHGIESGPVRTAAGKTAEGRIHLTARHTGSSIEIQIKDDGAGIDAEAVRKKALEKGLISAEANLSEKEIFNLIFMPGFSTAKTVTNVSGRGVGMEVVKKKIEALRGTVEIASVKGRGTTLTLRLPLSLAIIDGLLVQIGGEKFVLPLAPVEECVELTRQDLKAAHGREVASIRGEIVPYIHLRERFAIDGNRPEIEQIVVMDIDDRRIGFVVDYVFGEHQTVIKSLGQLYRNVKGFSGATILGDGNLALILDVRQLIEAEVTLQNPAH